MEGGHLLSLGVAAQARLCGRFRTVRLFHPRVLVRAWMGEQGSSSKPTVETA